MDAPSKSAKAYLGLGDHAAFYDGMITCSSAVGRLICRLVWGMDRADNDAYIARTLAAIPPDFAGRLLEIPVGTGVLSLPRYRSLDQAQIVCADASPKMLEAAERRAARLGLQNVTFEAADVGRLPYKTASFDLVLSLNGFHAFPDKEAAYSEIDRVLKPGGLFCGCCYIAGQVPRTDWLIQHLYVPLGYFTPPFETLDSLRARLEKDYRVVVLSNVKSIACFHCRKAAVQPGD